MTQQKKTRRLFTADRAHWLGAVFVAGALTETCRLYFNARTSWVILSVVLVVFFLSEVQKSPLVARMRDRRDRRSDFTRRVDDYALQLEARRAQRPWLVVSLVSAALVYLLSLYDLALSDFSEGDALVPEYLPLLLAIVVSMATMTIAGAVAEDDPPLEGRHDILKYLSTYEAQQPEKLEELWDRINQGTWVLTDLIAFAASEDEHRRLEAQRIAIRCEYAVTIAVQIGSTTPPPG